MIMIGQLEQSRISQFHPYSIASPLSDEEGSTSSTFYVQPTSLSKTETVQQTTMNRRVRFAEHTTTYSHVIVPEQDDCDMNQWYSSQDYQEFRHEYTQAIKMVIRLERGKRKDRNSYSGALDRLYQSCCAVPMSRRKTLQEENEATQESVLSAQDGQVLGELLSVSYAGRIGLEKVAIRRLRLDKRPRRDELIHAVLDIQEDQDYPYASAEQRACTMALVAQEISRPSRIWAAQIAQASLP